MEIAGDIKIINKHLLHFAHVPDKPKEAIFRLVWSENELELRKGTFNDYTKDTDLFVRQFTGVRQVKKYAYLEPSWVLEKWVPPAPGIHNDELVEAHKGTYEPFFVFRSAKGEFLQPTLKVVMFIVESATRMTKTTPTEENELAARAEDLEVQEFMDQIDTSPIQNALRMRDAVGYTKEISHV